MSKITAEKVQQLYNRRRSLPESPKAYSHVKVAAIARQLRSIKQQEQYMLKLLDEAVEKEKVRFPVVVDASGGPNMIPICFAANCARRAYCANHQTAGDYRTEDGMTPNLVLRDGQWLCTKKVGPNNGAILANGTLAEKSYD